MVEKDSEFHFHTCEDSPDGKAVIVFNSDLEGLQDQQICIVPIYAGTRPNRPVADYNIEKNQAERVGEFIVAALNFYVASTNGNAAYRQLIQHLYALARQYSPEPEYFDGIRICPVGHTFHIDDEESLITDGEPGYRQCPVCHLLVE